jgi:cytochrome c biogenesis protein CcdA
MNYFQISSAFLEGFFMVLSPCIISILPIVLSSSLDGGKQRPIGVILGLVLSFSLFSLLVGKFIDITGVSPQFIKLLATSGIVLFAAFMIASSLIEKFSEKFNFQFSGMFSSLTRVGGSLIQSINSANLNSDFLSGLLVGSCLGLIWTPCIGPIVGLAVSQAVSQVTFVNSLIVIASFSLGAALPMLLLTIYGKALIEKFSFFKKHNLLLKQVLGSVILFSVFLNSGQSLSYANNWVKANVWGDPHASLVLHQLDVVKPLKTGCSLQS